MQFRIWIVLTPVTLNVILGLEEGADYFERTDALLESVNERVGEVEFYSAVWRCVLSSSAARLPAVQLVLRRFDRKKSTEDQLHVIGSDINVMVSDEHSVVDKTVRPLVLGMPVFEI